MQAPAGGAGSQILGVAVSPNGQNAYAGLAGGIYVSTDAGGNWSAKTVNFQGVTVNAIAVDPTDPNKVYAGTSAGIFRSTDAGNNWTQSNNGLTDTTVYAVGV